MSIGANIKKRRYELRLSQKELADLMGYKTRSTIAKIESGENDVTGKKLQRFAVVLDTTVDYLLGATDVSGNDYSYQNEAVEKKNKTVAVILAGGKSNRNQMNIPNQFIDILGKPVIVYCLEAYQKNPIIDDLYIVCLRGWENIVRAYASQYHIDKLRGIIPAASSGILSVENGLNHIKDKYQKDDIIVFQESTRPMVSVEMISKLLQNCYINGSTNICRAMNDYVQFRYVDGKANYINRNEIVDLQSPEAYKFSVIESVFQQAREENHELSESCCAMLMYNLGRDINFIEGSNTNIKIIRQEDIAICTALIKGMD